MTLSDTDLLPNDSALEKRMRQMMRSEHRLVYADAA